MKETSLVVRFLEKRCRRRKNKIMSFVDYLINFVVFLGLLVAGIFIIIFAGAFFVSFETFNLSDS